MTENEPKNIVNLKILDLRPNNWYINAEKLNSVRKCLTDGKQSELPPVLVTIIDNEFSLIDGHSRVYAAFENGEKTIKVEIIDLSEIEGSRALYEHIHNDGPKHGIRTIADLKNRIVSPEEHKKLWIDYCEKWLEENEKRHDNVSDNHDRQNNRELI